MISEKSSTKKEEEADIKIEDILGDEKRELDFIYSYVLKRRKKDGIKDSDLYTERDGLKIEGSCSAFNGGGEFGNLLESQLMKSEYGPYSTGWSEIISKNSSESGDESTRARREGLIQLILNNIAWDKKQQKDET